MNTKRFLSHVRAAEEALWQDNRELFEGIAHEVALRYGLPSTEAEVVAADIRAALWASLGDFVVRPRRSRQELLASEDKWREARIRRTAYRAATASAVALLPENDRMAVSEKRARRRKGPSCASPSGPS